MPKLSVQIQLEGAKEIEQQLAGISKAGEQCFSDISKAAEQAGGFAKLDPAVIDQKFKALGVSVPAEMAKIKAALQSSENLEATVLGVANLEKGFNRVHVAARAATGALGLTRGEIGALGKALRAIDLGVVGSQLSLIGRVGGAFGPVGIAITAVAVAFAGLGGALVKFATDASETEKALTQLQKSSGELFQNLSSLQQVFAAGGTPAKEFADAFGKLSVDVSHASSSMAENVEQSSQRIAKAQLNETQATLSVKEAELALLEMRTKAAGIDTNTAYFTQAKQRLALEEAQQRVLAAQQAQEDAIHQRQVAQANDLSRIIRLYQQMAEGAKVAFDPLTTGSTKSEALLATLAKAGENWKSVLADIVKNASELGRVQIGKSLGLSPEMIETLSRGSEGLRQLQREAERLGLTLDSSNQQALQQMSQQWNQFTGLLSAFFQKIGALAAPALSQMYTTFTTVLQQIISDFQSLPLDQAIANVGDRLGPAFEAIGNLLAPVLTAIGTMIGDALGKAFVNAVSASINEGLQNMKDKWGWLFSGSTPSPAQSSGGGFASGGLLGGRGSGTSDSNLAWVSRGEYITPASAVAQPGVLAFLEALRRSGGNLRNVLDGMGHFALGGMVRGPLGIPAFAGGGMHAVTINFPGLPEITGLRGSSGVVDELRKAAALAQVRSGGRKPSRFS